MTKKELDQLLGDILSGAILALYLGFVVLSIVLGMLGIWKY